jgi:hypothetical protein
LQVVVVVEKLLQVVVAQVELSIDDLFQLLPEQHTLLLLEPVALDKLQQALSLQLLDKMVQILLLLVLPLTKVGAGVVLAIQVVAMAQT